MIYIARCISSSSYSDHWNSQRVRLLRKEQLRSFILIPLLMMSEKSHSEQSPQHTLATYVQV